MQFSYWFYMRCTIALVWFYQGGWMKILAVDPRHLQIVQQAIPFGIGRLWLGLIGLVECLLAVWFLHGWKRPWAAWTQVILLFGMNTMGILTAREQIPDPMGMVLMNLVFVLAILGAGGVWRSSDSVAQRG